MVKYRKYASYLLYVISVLAIVGVGFDAMLISGKYIVSGKEINIYGLIYYYQFLFLSIVVWGLSFWLSPNAKLSVAYWVIFFIITALVTL